MSDHLSRHRRLCVAPMMAWTDRHCRYLHRLAAPQALLFTEMIATPSLLLGPGARLLQFGPAEHPVAVQLGGSDPRSLAQAARMAAKEGYDEINLNVGCPSPRVSTGGFGACLMLEPALVAECVAAMRAVVDVPVTVKCRLGVDDADSDALLHGFVERVAAAGCMTFYVHARKALLDGLSPAQNRSVPPLQYHRVHELKAAFPDLEIVLNGGLTSVDAVAEQLRDLDGAMIGRAAYHDPMLLTRLHARLYGDETGSAPTDAWNLAGHYLVYMEHQLQQGVHLKEMTRHMLGLFGGMRGARRFRQMLSDARALARNDPDLVREALETLRALSAAQVA
ncbi:MAG: tRNA dihydrouridine(20/20a) synthase DusA [Pseudomonadales bacterium]